MTPNTRTTAEKSPKSFRDEAGNFWHNTLTLRGRRAAAGTAAAALLLGGGAAIAGAIQGNHEAPVSAQEKLDEVGEEFKADIAKKLGENVLTSVAIQDRPGVVAASHIDHEGNATKITVDYVENTASLEVLTNHVAGADQSAVATFTIPESHAQWLASEAQGDGVNADELQKGIEGSVQTVLSDQATDPDGVSADTNGLGVGIWADDDTVIAYNEDDGSSFEHGVTAPVKRVINQFEEVTADILK